MKCHPTAPEYAASGLKRLAIIGPANTGKSALFNKLTGSYSEVANYAHTTIEAVEADARLGEERYTICDTPGLNSLTIGSIDEGVARDILLGDRVDGLIFVGDATRLKRSLMLLAQTMETGLPIVFILNKVDEAAARGIIISATRLAEQLKIPVVQTDVVGSVSLTKIGDGIRQMAAAEPIRYPRVIEEAVDNLLIASKSEQIPTRAIALLALAGDRTITGMLARHDAGLAVIVRDAIKTLVRKAPGLDIAQTLFSRRESWADNVADSQTAPPLTTGTGFAQRAAWASRHPVLGWPILLGVMWLTIVGVGFISSQAALLLDTWLFIPLTVALDQFVSNPLLSEFLFGNFGALTMGVMNAVGTVGPILIVFFLIINFLEDVGYLPNLSVLLNRFFSLFGLTGKAILAVSLGFGCNTMATLTSRMLETKKERIIASGLIALGIPCAVQLGVMIAILATAPFSALLLVVGTVLATQMVVGVAMNYFLTSDQPADFIIELPPFRWPRWDNIYRKTLFRVKMFFNEALPLFVLGAILMFVLEKTGALTIINAAARPLITGLLSLPERAIEVFILVISRRELGAVYFKDMVDAGLVDYYQVVVGLTVMTLFIPCVSNTMVMMKELGLRWALFLNSAIMVIAIAIGALQNAIIRLF